jgi:hypothetical protein
LLVPVLQGLATNRAPSKIFYQSILPILPIHFILITKHIEVMFCKFQKELNFALHFSSVFRLFLAHNEITNLTVASSFLKFLIFLR